MLSCVYCTAFFGRDATVDPHLYLVPSNHFGTAAESIRHYRCSQCATEWGILEQEGVRRGNWIRQTPAKAAS